MKKRIDYITNSSSTSYLIEVNIDKLDEQEKAILEFILDVEEDETDKSEILKEIDSIKLYRKNIDYTSGLEKLLDKYSKDKLSYRIDKDYC